MSLLRVKAKVKIVSEDEMEIEGTYDLGTIAKSSDWKWKQVAVPFEEVYRIIEYNDSKCVLQMYDEEKILVWEPFDKVFEKLDSLRRKYGQFEPEEPDENNETSEANSEEDE